MANHAGLIFNKATCQFKGDANGLLSSLSDIDSDKRVKLIDAFISEAETVLHQRGVKASRFEKYIHAYRSRLESMGENEDPDLIKSAFMTSVLYTPATPKKQSTFVYSHGYTVDRKWLGFEIKGKAYGDIRIGEVSSSTRAWLIDAAQNNVYQYLNKIFLDDAASMDIVKAYRSFVTRIRNIKDDEDPIVMANMFIAQMKTSDLMTDWKRADSTTYKRRKRNQRIAKGKHSGKVRNGPVEVKIGGISMSLDPTELDREPVAVKNGREVFFSQYCDIDKMDDYIEYHHLDVMDIGYTEDGFPCFTLQAGPDGSWAIYALKGHKYVRVFREHNDANTGKAIRAELLRAQKANLKNSGAMVC